LTYKDRRIIVENNNIKELLDMLSRGEFLIPSFQRSFVWNPEHISNLWDSIYHFYPIGPIIYWKTFVHLRVHRRIGGFYLPKNVNNGSRRLQSYILDGQQRITSLFVSFFGGKDKIREQMDFDYTLHFDLTNAKFFFEAERYKHLWSTNAAFLVRLQDVPVLPDDYIEQLSKISGFNSIIKNNLEQLKHVFTDYEIPFMRLKGFDIKSVCDIFERMNQGGIRLENLDIIIARNFHNNPTVIEEDFPITG
jgi:uncharacterized protein with ParB-like and HNH nuclease domain